MAESVTTQLEQLETARKLVLAQSDLYEQIIRGILPIIGPHARVELRRWGAEFFAETFASPAIRSKDKETLSLMVLQTIRIFLENPNEDVEVIKSMVQAAASIYGYVFKYIINNSYDNLTWGNMVAIKSNILRRWDDAVIGVRVCCIKFAQRVIQLQTPGVVADPRRPEQSEVSLAIVPRDHALIPPSRLEPEALGLLDRLLDIFNEQPTNPLLVTATLNCLGPLIRTRQTIAGKIVSGLVNYNPLKEVVQHMGTKTRIQMKSVDRTLRMLLLNTLRRDENGPFAGRIRQYLDRTAQARLQLFDEGRGKRPLPTEPTDGLDNAKRIRLGAEIPTRPSPPPLPPGPTSVAQLFTLTADAGLTGFDVTQLPIELIVKITLPVLHRIEQAHFEEAINHVRNRYQSLGQRQNLPPQGPPQQQTEEDEEDYEPDFAPAEDLEQIRNRNDALPPEDLHTPTEVALGPYKLPQPPPLTAEETEQIGKGTINRVFGMMNVLDEPSTVKRQKPGLNRLAGSSYDRDAWITVITRLATRAPAGLDESDADEDEEETSNALTKSRGETETLGESIRETLWKYIIEDFRARIPIAISWLNEEWYSDRLASQSSPPPEKQPKQHYPKWTLKILDSILPYLEPNDKLLIRFLSEIPSIDTAVLGRVKSLANDPERVDLAVKAIHYLILVRPPIRELCVDTLEDLWRNYDDARAPAKKLLSKWRPHILEDPPPPPTGANGTTSPMKQEDERSGSVVAAVG